MARGLSAPAAIAAPLEVVEFASLDDYQHIVGGWIEPVDIDRSSHIRRGYFRPPR